MIRRIVGYDDELSNEVSFVAGVNIETIEVNREDIGLLRLRTVGIKNQTAKEIENPKGEDGKYLPNVVLDLDYTVVIPKKKTEKK